MRVIVVGSGFGGLAAAIRLAAAGHEVTVLEKRDGIGGRAYQYELGGFRFDGGPTVLTAPFMFEELFALAGERLSDHVQLVGLDPFYRTFGADGQAFDYYASQDASLAQVVARRPSDGAGFQRLGTRISDIFDAFYPYTERSMMRPQIMLAMLPYLIQHRAMFGVSRMVDGFIRDPFLRQALSFHPLLIGGDPARTPALYSLIVEFERRWGVHYAMGGTGALVQALGDLLGRLGGSIALGADVRRIVVERGRASGVELADGSVLRADVVVSNADPGFTFGTLLAEQRSAAPARMRLRGARPSMSLHVLYLGADRTWPDSPLGHHNMLFARDQPRATRQVFAGPRRQDPASISGDDMFLYVHMPTRTDPSIAPPGCDALYVLVATRARPDQAGPQAETAAQEQRRVRTAVLDRLEHGYLPGLSDHVVVEHAIGPEHFRSELNTPAGAAFSLQPTLFQSGWFRPHNRARAVRGLYLVGAGTHPGAGVPAVLASGKIAAELIAADAGVAPAPAHGAAR